MATEVVKEVDLDYERQGAYGQSFEVYSTPIENIYVKLEIRTDSYGENEHIYGVAFVKPKEQIITIFEKL